MSTLTRATARKSLGKVVRTRSGKIPAHALKVVVAALQAGSVVIFPTETVYGIGTSAFSLAGIQRIYALKGRNWRKPLALLVHRLEEAHPLVESVPSEARRLASHFWPGPLTLVFKASPLGQLITGGLATIGIRIPDHPVALALLRNTGVPLATTSVNRSGQAPAVSGTASAKLFGSSVEWLIDSGACRVKKASSVVDLSHYPFMVIREGAIPKKELERVLEL
jgi:L-threonylcarbamoyladenylate synthase